MRATYIKPNSKTQQQCSVANDTLTKVLAATGMSKDEWTALMFEMGCQCVEMQEHDRDVGNLILQNVEYGFWAWWITAFLEHDRQLMVSNRLHNYHIEKDKLSRFYKLDFG